MRGRGMEDETPAPARWPPLLLAMLALCLTGTVSAQHGLPGVAPAQPLGLGLAVVRVTDAPAPLGLYPPPGLDADAGAGAPADSVTFVPRRGRASVGTAPPWFLPEVLDSAGVFGTVDPEGVDVLRAIAEKGTANGGPDGPPTETVELETVTAG